MKKDDFIKTINRIKMPDDSKIKIRENITSTNKVRYNMARKLIIVSVAFILIGVLTIIPFALNNSNADIPPIIESEYEFNSNIINHSNIVSAESNVSQEVNSAIESSAKIESEANSIPAIPDESKDGTGGYNYEDFCIHEKVWFGGYHTIPISLIEYIGFDKCGEWEYNASLTNRTEECQHGDANVYNFVRKFNISKEMFCDAYYKQASNSISGNYYNIWYNIDVLYSGTEEEYSNLYKERGEEIYREMTGRRVEVSLKTYLLECHGVKNANLINYTQLSILQIVNDYNISKSELEEAMNKVSDIWADEGYKIFKYAIDKIYNKDQNLTAALEKAKSGEIYPVQVDEMIRISD